MGTRTEINHELEVMRELWRYFVMGATQIEFALGISDGIKNKQTDKQTCQLHLTPLLRSQQLESAPFNLAPTYPINN